MNLILFDRAELSRPLASSDRRAVHLMQVLRRKEGDSFDAGIIDGPRGKGRLIRITSGEISMEFIWGAEPPLNDALMLIVGLPRPQTARDILRDATALGVQALHFVSTDKGDSNYAQSSLWHTGEWRRHLVLGAEQAFCTRLPKVTFDQSLPALLTEISAIKELTRVALDNYEANSPLGAVSVLPPAIALAIGPERGWAGTDREVLRQGDFHLAHLGSRVLRTETACIAGIAVLKAKKGWF